MGKNGNVHGITFGFSEDDCVKAFSFMDLELLIDSLLKKKSLPKSTVVNAATFLNQ